MSAHKSPGQSPVEMALVTPLLLVLLLITADSARAFSAHIEIGNAAREGANYGSRSYSAAADSSLIEEAVWQESGEIFGSLPVVNSRVATDSHGYDFVEVVVTYQFEPIIDVPGLPGEFTLQRTASVLWRTATSTSAGIPESTFRGSPICRTGSSTSAATRAMSGREDR